MREYTISRVGTTIDWFSIPSLAIDNNLWLPEAPVSATAQLCYNDDALHICLTAQEKNIRAEESGPIGEPCNDSCLEFFFSPLADDERYINIECNPNGCVYLGIGRVEDGRVNLFRLVKKAMPIQPEIVRTQTGWSVTYSIPFDFIRMFFPGFNPKSGASIRANAYKCGDKTVQPHYLAWNPVDLPNPNFHCPDFFGTMYFQ